MAIRIILTFLFMSFLLSSTILGYNHDEVKSWCSKTPNPQPCEYFLSHDRKNTPIQHESDFLKISIELALDRAMHGKANTYSLGSKCRNGREKAAWEDCLELYEEIVLWLNKTTGSKCTKYDAQTWLSTALTNLETCRTGFTEFGVTDYVLPLMSNNVSKLISNTLALNKAPYDEPSYKDGFPSWIKPGDRKLLQSSSPASQANIVVAQDGSGNVKTIKEAIDAASKRSGSGRYVIYVKAGTYNENVEVGKNVKNVMFVGDGIGKTVVTGSKSVGGGTTTFKSATFAVVGDNFIARDMTFRNRPALKITRQLPYVPAPIYRCSTSAASKDTKTLSTSILRDNSTENVTSMAQLTSYLAMLRLFFKIVTSTHETLLTRPTPSPLRGGQTRTRTQEFQSTIAR
ncbi:pectin methylesterase LuPME1 family protein [Salix suchowensis]|nr:pectin methylesterase LuPME1 family protein [Salix suchowensis]